MHSMTLPPNKGHLLPHINITNTQYAGKMALYLFASEFLESQT